MPLARITGQGLASIAILVTLLWACAIGEHIVVRRANGTATEALRAMRSLRIRALRPPASTPLRPARSRPRPTVG